LTATPDVKSAFSGWTGACAENGVCTLTLSNSTSDAVTASFGLTLQSAINHIIFLAQENRSLDHYFGALTQYWQDDGYVHYKNQAFNGLPQFPTNAPKGPAPTNPGCNPADPFTPPASTSPDCTWDPTHPVTSFHLQTMCVENPSPSWNESHVDWNFNDPTGATMNPTLDGFVWTTGHDSRAPVGNGSISQFMDTDGIRVMGYYDGSDLNYYYFMASNFATSDTWFSPVMSRTNPNREYLIAGTSYGFAYPNGTNAADNMQIPSPIIFEELENAGISWKVYVYPDPNPNTYGTLSCAANDTRPQCLYQISYLHNFTYGQTIINQYPQNLVPISQFYTDAAAGTLPQVAQIEPASAKGLDEHAADFDPPAGQPACCSVQAGAAYVKSLIDAVMGPPSNPSPSWKDSVFILTYDEFGGFYDHVAPYTPTPAPDNFPSPVDLFKGPPPPGAPGPDVCVKVGGPTCEFQYTGYRVPLIVVSPFTKQNFVSHVPADYTAILKLIEDRFNLNPLTARDAFQISMDVEFFDFVKEPWKTPPVPPDQTTNGKCYLDHLP
jgi:phospholipase C